uniref:Uncharacterized protein n=1 Tax=Romanomermis culicivorax TaxID=13658 RepID=A0A915HXG5_ROMCU
MLVLAMRTLFENLAPSNVLSESGDIVQISQENEHCGTNTRKSLNGKPKIYRAIKIQQSCEDAASLQELKRKHLEEEHDFKIKLMEKEEEDRQS